MARPIEVQGAISITKSGAPLHIRALGRQVVCDLPDLSMGWSLLTWARRLRSSGLPLVDLFEATGLTLSIRCRGRVIAEAGPGIMPGRLSRWFGFDGLRLRPFRRPS